MAKTTRTSPTLTSPPLYNQTETTTEDSTSSESSALRTVCQAYDESSTYQKKYQELWRQLWLLWRFYRSTDSAVKVFDPLGFAMVNGLLSKIFVQTPKVILTAKNGQWRWLAKILQSYLEHQFANPDSDDPIEEEFISFITELLVVGTGVAKVCWHTKFITQFEEQKNKKTGQMERVAVEKKAFDDPTFEHIPREKFFIQPGAKKISESKYAIFEKDVNTEYLRDLQKITDPLTDKPLYDIPEELFSAASKPEDDDGGIEQARQPKQSAQDNGRKEGWFQLLEYWEDDKYIVVINKTHVIRGPEDNPNDDGKKPFVAMSYVKVPHEFDGIGALEPIMDLQRAQNITLTQRLEYVSNLLNQQFAIAGTLDANDEDALIEGYPIVHVQTPDAIKPLIKGNIDQGAFVSAGEIKEAVERTMGISGYQLGSPASSADKTQGTASGIQTIVSEAQTRFSMVLKRFENIILKGTAKRFLDLDRQYFSETEEKMIMVNDGSEPIPVPLTKELIQATEFHVNIVPGSTGVIDKQNKAQQFLSWAQLGATMLPEEFDRKSALLEAGNLFDVEQPERFILKQQPAPQGPSPIPGQAPQPQPQKESISINYKDAPEDIKRQMEMDAGFQPSQLPPPQPVAPVNQPINQIGANVSPQ